MNIQDAYKNKLFSILGDSISTLDGYTEPDGAAFYTGMEKFRADVFTPDDTWWGQVIQYLGGMTYGEQGWVAEFANEEPEGHPWRIHRRHIYRVIGNDLYDLCFDLHLITREEAEELAKVIQFPGE